MKNILLNTIVKNNKSLYSFNKNRSLKSNLYSISPYFVDFLRIRNSLFYFHSKMVDKIENTNVEDKVTTEKPQTGEKKNFVVWDNVLKNAVEGKVVTRFPPEPSGYLHIGHIKAVILNRYLADLYKGKMIVRFDDTNPEKESLEFVDNIIEDLKSAGIVWEGEITHVTDYFAICEQMMTTLIEKGVCYCDNTPVDKTREERDKGIASKCRDQSPEENMKIWVQMMDKKIAADSPIKQYCVRGKIDMKCKNKHKDQKTIFRKKLDN